MAILSPAWAAVSISEDFSDATLAEGLVDSDGMFLHDDVNNCINHVCGLDVIDFSRMNDWEIVIADNPAPAQQYAAEEFQRFFALASGVELPIKTTVTSTTKPIYIGSSTAMQQSGVDFETADMDEEEYRIIINKDTIIIAGGIPNGTIYGVYTFLEDYLGMAFLAEDYTHIETLNSSHSVLSVDRQYSPQFNFRVPMYYVNGSNPAFAARIKVNTDPVIKDGEEVVADSENELINHSFFWQLPVEVYGQQHPEYFALVNGQRLLIAPGSPQLCLTNPDVLAIVTASVLSHLQERPYLKNVSVAQNDNQLFCTCANCTAIDATEESHMGSLLQFVNAVADEVAQVRPDVMVGTLAYQYTRKPSKTIRPRPNVQIQLCSIECCQVHPLDDSACPLNVPFCNDLDGWGEICNEIYIWSYMANFRSYLQPFPNVQTIGPNIRYFASNNTKGVLMQASYNTKGGDLNEMRNYITARLLWNPELDDRKLIEDFAKYYYGNASGTILEYLDYLKNHAIEADIHMHCFGKYNGIDYSLDWEMIDHAEGLFQTAFAQVQNDPNCYYHVEKAYLSILFARLGMYNDQVDQAVANGTTLPPSLCQELHPIILKFEELCIQGDVTRTAENKFVSDMINRFKTATGLN